MYYAEKCPYGVRTISDGDRLYRFETMAERDMYVLSEGDENARALSYDEARRRYRMQDFGSPYNHGGYVTVK